MAFAAVETRAAGRPLVLLRPDWSQPGRSSVDILSAAARARDIHGAVCLLPAADTEVVPLAFADVPVIEPDGINSVWLTAICRSAAMRRALRESWRRAAASVSHELYREFRRQASNERLPLELRQGLRAIANRAQQRTRDARTAAATFPRRLLRTAPAIALPPAALELGRVEAAAMGIPEGAPLVLFEGQMRPDIAAAAISLLAARGYTVVVVGSHALDLGQRAAVVDLTARRVSLLIQLFLLSTSRFVVSGAAAMQQLSYLTNTASLVVNVADPFGAYPIRANGLFMLKTPIDLDTGRVLAIDDLLTERYFQNLRNYGYRENTAGELTAAIEEMHAGLQNGWSDTTSQARFRSRVVDTGTALAAAVPHVAEWGPDEGFIGDGRLARVQAERTS